MNVKKVLLYSFSISSFFLILSLLFSFVPCRLAPNVPNPFFSWTFCSLDPTNPLNNNTIIEYFGLTTSLKLAYFILLGFFFLVSFVLIFSFFKRKKS